MQTSCEMRIWRVTESSRDLVLERLWTDPDKPADVFMTPGLFCSGDTVQWEFTARRGSDVVTSCGSERIEWIGQEQE